jgi:hypothetical protein
VQDQQPVTVVLDRVLQLAAAQPPVVRQARVGV